MSLLTSSKIQRYVYLESIASTNDYLIEYLSKNNPLQPVCAYTFNQTSGKGQIGRKWFSDTGKNISLSLLLKFADLPVHQHYHLNKSICLSLLSFVSDLLPAQDLKIKWPNDIYFKDKKIAGLLIQNQLKSQSIQNTIIGIGLNINQDSFPEELAHASSVFQISGSPLNLFETTIDLVNKFMMQLDINLLDPVQVENIYHKQLYALNKKRQFRISQEEDSFEGIIRGVSKDGKLQLEANGTVLQFSNGEVELIPLNES